MGDSGYSRTRQVLTILPASTASATGGAFVPKSSPIFFMATISGTAALTGTIIVEATNDPLVTTSWLTLGTIALTGTTTAQDGFSSSAQPANVRARLSALTGTSASVIVTMAT